SDILSDIESARGDNFGARGHDGHPPTDDQIGAAREQFLSDQRALYRYWVDLLIVSGADQVATMLDKGVTPETLSWATGLGALAATPGAFSLFQSVWQHDADAMSAATDAERLAEDFMRDGKLSDADLQRLHELLRANDRDPVFAEAFMTALGPHRLL